MALSWRLANSAAIMATSESGSAWHAGHVADALFVPGRRIIAGAPTGGVWSLRGDGDARCLTDDWDDPDVKAMAYGPDGPRHVFVATTSAVWESRRVPDGGWTRHSMPANGVHSLELLASSRRLIAAGEGGVWWAEVPESLLQGPFCGIRRASLTGPDRPSTRLRDSTVWRRRQAPVDGAAWCQSVTPECPPEQHLRSRRGSRSTGTCSG